ncbi:uncharacterized protein LACBIDRAFT_332045 [Laccaria bicolor S238N-H82]|uniref:Predicted protein n=1 Tax=Laccaria bicolor (strain S238N-H82 / ATCC MYA-4686) TaxID=486041 RepID=B0DRE2_LACBS|nr:uncharacterized protein LACBIDRAFT_332045 [Laccaria bicolor S238N-H82]EDR02855.1 predicted protein [Laccaria bicolor S238N-H82]|eukprot:XP_001886565.1 predicted protein [Laccaria bicolor S238N-H82]
MGKGSINSIHRLPVPVVDAQDRAPYTIGHRVSTTEAILSVFSKSSAKTAPFEEQWHSGDEVEVMSPGKAATLSSRNRPSRATKNLKTKAPSARTTLSENSNQGPAKPTANSSGIHGTTSSAADAPKQHVCADDTNKNTSSKGANDNAKEPKRPSAVDVVSAPKTKVAAKPRASKASAAAEFTEDYADKLRKAIYLQGPLPDDSITTQLHIQGYEVVIRKEEISVQRETNKLKKRKLELQEQGLQLTIQVHQQAVEQHSEEKRIASPTSRDVDWAENIQDLAMVKLFESWEDSDIIIWSEHTKADRANIAKKYGEFVQIQYPAAAGHEWSWGEDGSEFLTLKRAQER